MRTVSILLSVIFCLSATDSLCQQSEKIAEDLYQVLGVRKKASSKRIADTYWDKVFECHPYTNPGNNVKVRRFTELCRAYYVLSNKERRKVYDKYGLDSVDMDGFDASGYIFSPMYKKHGLGRFGWEVRDKLDYLDNANVIIRFKVTENAKVTDIRVHKSSGYENFDKEAVRAVAQLAEEESDQFLPAIGPDGKPKAAWRDIIISFVQRKNSRSTDIAEQDGRISIRSKESEQMHMENYLRNRTR